MKKRESRVGMGCASSATPANPDGDAAPGSPRNATPNGSAVEVGGAKREERVEPLGEEEEDGKKCSSKTACLEIIIMLYGDSCLRREDKIPAELYTNLRASKYVD